MELKYRQVAAATTRVRSIGGDHVRRAHLQLAEISRVIRGDSGLGEHEPLLDFADQQPTFATTLAASVLRAVNSGTYLVVDDESVALSWIPARTLAEMPLLRAVDALSELSPTRPVPDGGATPGSAADSPTPCIDKSAIRARRALRERIAAPASWRPEYPRVAKVNGTLGAS